MKQFGSLVVALMVVGSLGLFPGKNALALSLDFVPSQPMSVVNGGTYDVDIILSGLSVDGEIVSAFDLDVLFDADLLHVDDVVFGAELGDPLLDQWTVWDDSDSGLLDLAALSFLSDDELALIQDDNVLLATISFSGIDDGEVELSFTNWGLINDIKGRDAEIIYSPIPEPSTMLLMGAGLAGVAALSRRRRQ